MSDDPMEGLRAALGTALNPVFAERDVLRALVGELVEALERIDRANRNHEDAMGRANEHTRAIRSEVIAALRRTT